MARLQRQHPVLHRGPLPKPYLNLKIGHGRRMQRHFTEGGVISSAAVATVSCEMHLQHAPRAAGRKHVKCVCNTYQGAAGWKQQKASTRTQTEPQKALQTWHGRLRRSRNTPSATRTTKSKLKRTRADQQPLGHKPEVETMSYQF